MIKTQTIINQNLHQDLGLCVINSLSNNECALKHKGSDQGIPLLNLLPQTEVIT